MNIHWRALNLILLMGMGLACPSRGDEPELDDGWARQHDEQTSILLQTRELTLVAKAAPDPALRYRLIPDAFERLPENAAVYYLKALGFLEQTSAREGLNRIARDSVERAAKEQKDISDLPPHVWNKTPPPQLPLTEVRDYLALTAFQIPMLREAARRDHFDMNRNFREVNDPIAFLLPEIQVMRELARTQSIRCRFAIAENRIDDAIEIIGQQFALARHMGQDDFLVSNLVGIAIATIAWNDALYLVQHPAAPNLYWALSTMPSPLVDITRSMAFERQFLYLQLKVLREVSEQPRPAGYWQDFLDRLVPQIGMLSAELGLPATNDPAAIRAGLVAMIAASYPGAKQYLIHECKLSREQVEAYPTAQVVFLAAVRFYDHWRDEVFKWMHLPYHQASSLESAANVDAAMRAEAEKYGWSATPAQLLLPAVRAARTAETRCQQSIALLRTVEAIRMYAAENNGKLPLSLDALSVPAPIEPFTGKPIHYELHGDRAVLNGHAVPGMRYRLILRIAP